MRSLADGRDESSLASYSQSEAYPSLCLTPHGSVGGMNNESQTTIFLTDNLIASFGEARLVRREGRVFLVGGTMSDRTEALEWAMLFLPEEAVQLRS